jgi:hypothetical protein
MRQYPVTDAEWKVIVEVLRELYPEPAPRQGYTDDQHRVSLAYHDDVIDDIEMEVLYEFLDSGVNMLADTNGVMIN